MSSPPLPATFRPERSDWLRLQTLVLLRWMAIFGQVIAIAVATRVYHITLPIGLCFLAIGAAIIANLVLIAIFPPNKRLSETEAMLTLVFDLSQLSFPHSCAGYSFCQRISAAVHACGGRSGGGLCVAGGCCEYSDARRDWGSFCGIRIV